MARIAKLRKIITLLIIVFFYSVNSILIIFLGKMPFGISCEMSGINGLQHYETNYKLPFTSQDGYKVRVLF